ncbi:MAG: asparagine synthase (glutamine-hydrolyzing) [Clostridium sp.]
MCGFITLLKKDLQEEDVNKCRVGSSVLKHRGPDDNQEVVDNNAILSFNRLSIVDLELGKQPYNFKDKYMVVFNGEIYNYIDIREDLIKEGYEFHTNSEIEVIASLYDSKGVDFVNELRGMFAINIYDVEKEKFIVTRDHFGIKPLYYMGYKDGMFFSSELKALSDIAEDLTYNDTLLNQYLTFQYVPEYDTLFDEIKLLPPGHIAEMETGKEIQIRRYFTPELKPTEHADKEKLKADILATMRESVKRHMISDVPVAAFLSSGIDSSIIVKLASELNPDITTFSIGFDIEGYDETVPARRFADEIGVKNVSVKINYKDYVRDLPRIIYHMDNPIADPSIIPLYHICKAVSDDYKVILSGEGSDEFFGGYNIYTEDNSLKVFEGMPGFMKSAVLGATKVIPNYIKGKSYLERGCTDLSDRYVGNANIFREDEKCKVLKNYDKSIKATDVTGKLFKDVEHLDNVCKRQYVDINTWLVGDILTKADRMSMANSLESRVPFLDVEVFKLASTLSKDEKINGFTTKHMLREAFKDVLPEYVYHKKKLGYPVPIRVWLKDELYDWAYNLIAESNIPNINKDEALKMLDAHKAGKADFSRKVWSVIVYIIWYRLYVEKTLTKEDQFIVE